MAGPSRPILLLALGAAGGLAAAAIGLLDGGDGVDLPGDVAARVNGHAITMRDYRRALDGLASDRREPLGPAEARHVLDRLIDEELLVQRGLELGLARLERRVRADLVSAVIQSAVAAAETDEPSREELEAFYRENARFFAGEGRLWVRQILVRAGALRPTAAARQRAEEAAAALRGGEAFAVVAERFGDEEIGPVPSGLLPPSKLRQYLGPGLVDALLDVEPGEVAGPLESSAGFHLLEVVERTDTRIPGFAEVEEQVRAEARRRAGDRALRDYIAGLRARAEIHTGAAVP